MGVAYGRGGGDLEEEPVVLALLLLFAAWLVVALNFLVLLALFLGLFTRYASMGIRKGRKAFDFRPLQY